MFLSDILIKARDYVADRMYEYPLKWLVYHNFDHVQDVFNRASYLAEKENIGLENTEILLLAILFHDVNFFPDPSNHEEVSAQTAEKFLLDNSFPEDKIDIVKSIILSTSLANSSWNLLQSIASDADLDNFWRDDFFEKTMLVKEELENLQNISINEIEFYENTLKIMENIRFYTTTQLEERQKKFEENLAIIKDKIKNT